MIKSMTGIPYHPTSNECDSIYMAIDAELRRTKHTLRKGPEVFKLEK